MIMNVKPSKEITRACVVLLGLLVSFFLVLTLSVVLLLSDPPYVEIRMDVYEGDEPGYCLTEVSKVGSNATPVEDVRIRFIEAGSSFFEIAESGTVRTAFQKKKFGESPVEIHFKCWKEGYGSVKGTFALKEFMGEEDKTVLVKIKHCGRTPIRENGEVP